MKLKQLKTMLIFTSPYRIPSSPRRSERPVLRCICECSNAKTICFCKVVCFCLLSLLFNQLFRFIYYLGLDNLISDVQRAVKSVVSSYSLKDQVSSVTIQDIVSDVRRQLEYRRENGYHDVTSSSLCRYMMPTSEGDSQVVTSSV